MKVIKPPHSIEDISGPVIFLAGSIEMDKAENWQTEVEDYFTDVEGTILNPRRDQWDSSWEQSIDNPQFNEQVTWELDGLDRADIIIVYFDPKTKSPITLMELGLHATSDKLIVCCPDGYWRKGNVDILCRRFQIPMVNTLEHLCVVTQYEMEERQLLD